MHTITCPHCGATNIPDRELTAAIESGEVTDDDDGRLFDSTDSEVFAAQHSCLTCGKCGDHLAVPD